MSKTANEKEKPGNDQNETTIMGEAGNDDLSSLIVAKKVVQNLRVTSEMRVGVAGSARKTRKKSYRTTAVNSDLKSLSVSEVANNGVPPNNQL